MKFQVRQALSPQVNHIVMVKVLIFVQHGMVVRNQETGIHKRGMGGDQHQDARGITRPEE